MKSVFSIVLAVLLSSVVGDDVKMQSKSLRPTDAKGSSSQAGVVQPMEFNQKLLICNAYPSDSPVTIKKNAEVMIADDKTAINYKDCRYISSHVLAHDKLDFVLKDTGIEGTFEVGELPAGDAVLLLVLEKRDAKTPLVTFQSFAFPPTSNSKDAQLAAIDTFRAKDSMKAPHLKMADHMTGKEAQTVSKRVEELNFNRVYAIEEGSYDASVMDRALELAGQKKGEDDTRETFAMRGGENYVMLRVGDGEKFPQSLVFFPNNLHHSGAAQQGVVVAALLTLVGLLF